MITFKVFRSTFDHVFYLNFTHYTEVNPWKH